MIGDKIETDILGGLQAELGITVWVLNPEEGTQSTPNPPPDFTIPDVSELIQILQGGKDKNKAKNVRTKKNSTSGTMGENASALPVASTSSGSGSSSVSLANKSATAAEED
jgi:hypothetical protein